MRSADDPIPPETLREILSAPAQPIDRAFAAVCLLSGCRLGEVLGMRADRLNAEQREIIVGGKTGQRSVDLSISPALLALLTALAGRGRKLLFDYQTSARARDAYERVRRAGAPRWTPQVLRSTCATYLTAMRGASWESQQLGHSVVIAERNYVGLIRRIDAAAKTLEAAMGIEAEVSAIIAALG